MATLSEMMAAQPNGPAPLEGATDALKNGMQLAQAAEQVQMQRQQLEAQKHALAESKWGSFKNMMGTYLRAAPAVKKAMKRQFQERFTKLGADPAILDVADDEDRAQLYRQAMQWDSENPVDAAMGMEAMMQASAFDEAVMNLSTQRSKQIEARELKEAQLAASAANTRALSADRNSRFKESQNLKIDSKIIDYGRAIDTDPIMKKLREQDLAFDHVNTLLDQAETGNTVAFNSVGAKMAKAMGEVGVLTEEDVKRYVATKQISQKAGDTLLNWMQGAPTQATIDEVQEIAGAMRQGMGKNMGPIVDRWARRLQVNFGMSKEEAYNRLGYEDLLDYQMGQAVPKQPAAPATPAAAGGPTPKYDFSGVDPAKLATARQAGFTDDQIAAKLGIKPMKAGK